MKGNKHASHNASDYSLVFCGVITLSFMPPRQVEPEQHGSLDQPSEHQRPLDSTKMSSCEAGPCQTSLTCYPGHRDQTVSALLLVLTSPSICTPVCVFFVVFFVEGHPPSPSIRPHSSALRPVKHSWDISPPHPPSNSYPLLPSPPPHSPDSSRKL